VATPAVCSHADTVEYLSRLEGGHSRVGIDFDCKVQFVNHGGNKSMCHITIRLY
jgi:hypothetical protein